MGKVATNEKSPPKSILLNIQTSINPMTVMRSIFVLTVMVNISKACENGRRDIAGIRTIRDRVFQPNGVHRKPGFISIRVCVSHNPACRHHIMQARNLDFSQV
jgi:hypothetical protein